MVPPRCAAMAVNVYSLVRVVVTGSPVAVDVRVTVSSICSSISINFKVCNSTQKRLAWYSTSEQVAEVLRVVRGASCTATAHLLRCKRPKCVRAGTVGICPRRLKVYDRTLRYKVKCDAAQCARIGLFGVVGVKKQQVVQRLKKRSIGCSIDSRMCAEIASPTLIRESRLLVHRAPTINRVYSEKLG